MLSFPASFFTSSTPKFYKNVYLLLLVVMGCSEWLVENLNETLELLMMGNSRRVTKETQMNKSSSRSHAVFSVHLSKSYSIIPPSCHI